MLRLPTLQTLASSGSREIASLGTRLKPMLEGAADIAEGLRNWRIWHLLGTSELRRRYARSRLGQFWMTLSTAITVVTLGLVWALLWKLPVSELLPHVAAGFVAWAFITAFINDASNVFIGGSIYFLNQRMSFSTVVFSLAYRNLIVLAHNAVIVMLTMLYFAVPLTAEALLVIPGLILTTLAGFAIAYLIGMVCLRYRDLVQLVGNITQIIFFVTPVLWKESLLPPDKHWIVDYNPFAVFLSIIRDPILGTPVPAGRWLSAGGITISAILLALYVVGRMRHRIIYWI